MFSIVFLWMSGGFRLAFLLCFRWRLIGFPIVAQFGSPVFNNFPMIVQSVPIVSYGLPVVFLRLSYCVSTLLLWLFSAFQCSPYDSPVVFLWCFNMLNVFQYVAYGFRMVFLRLLNGFVRCLYVIHLLLVCFSCVHRMLFVCASYVVPLLFVCCPYVFPTFVRFRACFRYYPCVYSYAARIFDVCVSYSCRMDVTPLWCVLVRVLYCFLMCCVCCCMGLLCYWYVVIGMLMVWCW